ncbi:outer membrane protein assembly factor BamC [Vibrio mangrovi]|uniref:Outer membrane protein assembly factor BamC n=1 Tax=Vibrio mangrovi TaxID=474394 RepID=A0A1Y6ITU2_9VIBR|nr:outer membrane protein assembly factor BamC [Vibrio mangrovi]MDW6001535.1 outer membrane protein assembly factor BamC [Vibrio mangrovi]SMS00441.1 Outer membrane protein assembly factor BamC precursor [Vibrio mangrovi]
MKFLHQLVFSSLAVLMISACSDGALKRRTAEGDFEYLDSKLSTAWKMPQDAELQLYHDYDIPAGNYQGALGEQVDIRPPQSVLTLIPGVRIDSGKNRIIFWTVKPQLADQIWHVIAQFLEQHQVARSQSSASMVETSWVTWAEEDEVSPVKTRYRYTRLQQKNQYGVQVSLVDMQHSGTEDEALYNQDRYTVMMANAITTSYDRQAQEDAARKSRQMAQQIAVAMGTDRSGLPVVIARTSYDNMWQRLSDSLSQVGFHIDGRNRSQGTIKAKFSQPDDEVWQSLGVKPISLDNRTYTLLLGDLGNRTSINITDGDDKPVAEEKLKEFAAALSALFQ